jgi:glucosamine--fructose-6-phosphate aminotransferase (isomerizing)
VVEIDRTRGLTVTDFHGAPVEPTAYTVDWDAAAAEKGGYDWFMLKEIAEQPQAVADTLLGRLGDDGELVLDEVRLSDQDCATSTRSSSSPAAPPYHAGLIAKYAIEHWTRIPVEVEVASEFRYRDPVLGPVDAGRRHQPVRRDDGHPHGAAAREGAEGPRAGHLQRQRLDHPRESDAVLYTHAGPEIAVASTKGFLRRSSPATWSACSWRRCAASSTPTRSPRSSPTAQLPEAVAAGARPDGAGARAGPSLADADTILFLGRHVGLPVALEGALKLKELAYIHAEGFAAGELKHGPIALIDQGTPVVVVVPSPRAAESVHGKVVSNIQEVRARGARTIVIAEEGDDDVVPYADHLIRVPAHAHAAGAGVDHGAAAGARLRDRRHPRLRRRPAAQPGQERHRRVRSPEPAGGARRPRSGPTTGAPSSDGSPTTC